MGSAYKRLIRNKKNKGFTLVELILTLAVIAVISFTVFQSLAKDFENKQAEVAGQHIKNIGVAVNNYIVNHYDSISKLENSSGSTLDIGPRICDTGKLNCEISIQTLVNEGMLPPASINKNVYGYGYKIIISRKGTSPYWNVSALITTDKPLIVSGNIRYDLLGKAMQEAGVDSGMTRTLATRMDGYKGSWSAIQTDYTNINNLGLLGYIAGYGSNSYSAFLRRDGTLPMTGDLNMGTKNIYGANNITASGKGTFGGEVEAGSWVHAKNGYGDVVSIGGDAATNDYEIKLGSTKPLSIYGPAAIDVKVSGNVNASVDMTAGRNINAGNWLIAHNGGGDVMYIGGDAAPHANGTLGNDYEIRMATNKPLTIWNNSAGFSEDDALLDIWGSTRLKGNLAVNSTDASRGNITASGNITATKRITAGEYVELGGIVTPGQACQKVGLLSRDNAGQIVSCKAGIWQPEQPVGMPMPWPSTTPPAGWLICNGQTFNTNQYPLLAKAYPSGKLPDLRGNYIRGLDQGRGYDSEASRSVLSEQKDSLQNHSHSLPTSTGYVAGSNQGDSSMQSIFLDGKEGVMATRLMDPTNVLKNGNNATPTTGDILRTYDLNWSVSSPYSDQARFSDETRTKNVAFVYIVRAL